MSKAKDDEYHYVLEDAEGNSHEYSFGFDKMSKEQNEQILTKLRDLRGCKLHIYRKIKTIQG